ncbi:hypothetical protein I4U23_025313 [Adineta vaga]|nr:hypothetical protein I4U23_025313 [Adineta vaga]
MARRSHQKRRRDPNAPKQSQKPRQLFITDNREDIVKQYPNLSVKDISKKLGEMWEQSDEEIKRRYQKQYQTNQIEYQEKLATYKEEQKKKRSQSSKSNKNNSNDENNVESKKDDEINNEDNY